MKIEINKKDRSWKLGDVITDSRGSLGLIVKNNNGDYCVMDITPDVGGTYTTEYDFLIHGIYDTIDELKADLDQSGWLKVEAELNIKVD